MTFLWLCIEIWYEIKVKCLFVLDMWYGLELFRFQLFKFKGCMCLPRGFEVDCIIAHLSTNWCEKLQDKSPSARRTTALNIAHCFIFTWWSDWNDIPTLRRPMKSLEFGWKNLTMIFVVDINCFGMLKCNSTTLNFLVIILGVYLTTTVSSSSLGTVADR